MRALVATVVPAPRLTAAITSPESGASGVMAPAAWSTPPMLAMAVLDYRSGLSER